MRSVWGIIFTKIPLDVCQKWNFEKLAWKNNHKKATKNFQICEFFWLLGESCKNFQKPGKNYHFQNYAGTRCAKNNLKWKHFPNCKTWYKALSHINCRGWTVNFFNFSTLLVQFRSGIFSANILKLHGLNENFFLLHKLLLHFESGWKLPNVRHFRYPNPNYYFLLHFDSQNTNWMFWLRKVKTETHIPSLFIYKPHQRKTTFRF